MEKYELIVIDGRMAVKKQSSNGRWVEAKEAEALEQLNKEMLETLTDCLPQIEFAYQSGIEFGIPKESAIMQDKEELINRIQSIIAKAEEV